jgi:ketosteroid isomerase-like protein
MATSADTTSTSAVFAHHFQCLGAGDLPGLLADYTDESILITPDGSVLRGLEGVKSFFIPVFAEFAKPGLSLAVQKQVSSGEIMFLTWSGESADNVYEYCTDTFVIRDGKIAAQTFFGKITPKS